MSTAVTVPAAEEFLTSTMKRRIHFRVARLGRKFALPKEEREDLRQDFYLTLLTVRQRYDAEKCPLHRFLLMVINRRYKHHVRRLYRLSHHLGRTPNPIAFDDVEPDFEYLIVDPKQEGFLRQAEIRHDLELAFKPMTDIERKVCELLMSGHSPTEASRVLDVAPSTVTRAMERIRRHLSRAGTDPRT